MKHHWFFDFDGTLCNTEEDIKQAWKASLKALHRDCPQFDAIYRTGPRIDEIVYALFDDATEELVKEVKNQFRIYYDASGFPTSQPYPGIVAWLHHLKAQGCFLYVATNKRYHPMQSLMPKLKWDTLFDSYYAFDMYPGLRLPKAEMLTRVMKERHILPDDAVMVGDTQGDVEAGKAAGLWTIGCTWGYGTRAELEGADEIYEIPPRL